MMNSTEFVNDCTYLGGAYDFSDCDHRGWLDSLNVAGIYNERDADLRNSINFLINCNLDYSTNKYFINADSSKHIITVNKALKDFAANIIASGLKVGDISVYSKSSIIKLSKEYYSLYLLTKILFASLIVMIVIIFVLAFLYIVFKDKASPSIKTAFTVTSYIISTITIISAVLVIFLKYMISDQSKSLENRADFNAYCKYKLASDNLQMFL